jgi:hypothetical protein
MFPYKTSFLNILASKSECHVGEFLAETMSLVSVLAAKDKSFWDFVP